MVTQPRDQRARQSGGLMIELLVAMSMLTTALLPLAYSTLLEYRQARACYQRAVALELVDGEIEVLAAGEWRSFAPGTHEYATHFGAATNLPPGRLLLTIQPGTVRLEWEPAAQSRGGPVMREVKTK
jgi:hypothetical protein